MPGLSGLQVVGFHFHTFKRVEIYQPVSTVNRVLETDLFLS